jgi:aflatoxin B1 aldehyde reductase
MSFILGTMNIAYPSSSISHYEEQEKMRMYENIIHTYISQTETPILDSAYYYGNTQTERILGNILRTQTQTQTQKVQITTKANPWLNNDFTSGSYGQLSPFHLERQLNHSLSALQTPQVDVFFLHCPDPETPIEETVKTCDRLWRNEKFTSYGLSNFSLEQTEEVYEICERRGWHTPFYYQGMYNLLSRRIEELFPLLDDHGIEFWAYNPLAGGLLTGKYHQSVNQQHPQGNRFHNNAIYQSIFMKPAILDACNQLYHEVGDRMLPLSLKWLQTGSLLRPQDKIIMGASSVEQLEENTRILETPYTITTQMRENLDSLGKSILKDAPAYYY